jgi:hypothetical protein
MDEEQSRKKKDKWKNDGNGMGRVTGEFDRVRAPCTVPVKLVELGLTSSFTHSEYDALGTVSIPLRPSFCAAPPSGQLSLMNAFAFSRLLDPTAAIA